MNGKKLYVCVLGEGGRGGASTQARRMQGAGAQRGAAEGERQGAPRMARAQPARALQPAALPPLAPPSPHTSHQPHAHYLSEAPLDKGAIWPAVSSFCVCA